MTNILFVVVKRSEISTHTTSIHTSAIRTAEKRNSTTNEYYSDYKNQTSGFETYSIGFVPDPTSIGQKQTSSLDTFPSNFITSTGYFEYQMFTYGIKSENGKRNIFFVF